MARFTPRKKSVYWWVRYRDQSSQIIKESAGTKDREVADRFLRAPPEMTARCPRFFQART